MPTHDPPLAEERGALSPSRLALIQVPANALGAPTGSEAAATWDRARWMVPCMRVRVRSLAAARRAVGTSAAAHAAATRAAAQAGASRAAAEERQRGSGKGFKGVQWRSARRCGLSGTRRASKAAAAPHPASVARAPITPALSFPIHPKPHPPQPPIHPTAAHPRSLPRNTGAACHRPPDAGAPPFRRCAW